MAVLKRARGRLSGVLVERCTTATQSSFVPERSQNSDNRARLAHVKARRDQVHTCVSLTTSGRFEHFVSAAFTQQPKRQQRVSETTASRGPAKSRCTNQSPKRWVESDAFDPSVTKRHSKHDVVLALSFVVPVSVNVTKSRCVPWSRLRGHHLKRQRPQKGHENRAPFTRVNQSTKSSVIGLSHATRPTP